MNYKTLLLSTWVFLLLMTGPISRTSAQLVENFDSPTAPPDNWTMIYADPNPITGSLFSNEMIHIEPANDAWGSQGPHDTTYSGSRVFRFSSVVSSAGYDYRQYLISPPLNVTPGNDSVAFYYRPKYGFGDRFQVGYSTTTNDISAFTFEPHVITSSGDDQIWNLYYINNLPPNTKYICIQYGRATTSGYLFYIDGFYGPDVADLDAGMLAINTPEYPGISPVSVDFVNAGTTTLNSLKIDYEINGVHQGQVLWSGVMDQDSVITDYVLGNYDFSLGTHTVKAWVSEPNSGTDQNNTNDTIEKTFSIFQDATAYAGGDDHICAGEQLTVTGATATSYSALAWSTSGSGFFVNGSTLSPTYVPGAADTINGSVVLTLVAYAHPGYDNDTSNMLLTIHPTPAVDFTGLQTSYCPNDPDQTLVPSPSGGSFSGPGVSGNTFSPSSVAENTTHTITYSYQDANGCANSRSKNTTIHPSTAVSFSNLTSQYCENDPAELLAPTPAAGGQFFVNGVPTGNYLFDPSLHGVGSHVVEFVYQDANGCSFSEVQNTSVGALPVVTIDNLDGGYCAGDPAVTLQGSPSGGAFTINGTATTVLDPAALPLGSHNVKYAYTDPTSGCSDTVSATVEIWGLPNASFSGLSASYCEDEPNASLSASPAGGTFSGPGVSSTGTFTPASANAGSNNTITYTYTDANGCTDSHSQSTMVYELPSVTNTTAIVQACEDGTPVTLTGAPSGGTFSGVAVSGNQFDPVTAGVGIYPITYSYTDGNGCSNSDTKDMEVVALPSVSFSGLQADYCENEPNEVLTPTPAGGTFSISGGNGIVNGNEFSPAAAGSGTYVITYTYIDANGCTGHTDQTVTVNQVPLVTMSGLQAAYCNQTLEDTLTGLPSGGSFSGQGMTGNVFNPGTVPGGNNINITYTYTDANGCQGAITQSTLVRALPDASFSGLSATYCDTDGAATLAPVTSGGSFSGPGIAPGTSLFDPVQAGAGSHTISYTVTDSHGCTNDHTENTTVNTGPQVSFSGLAQNYCPGDPAATLTPNPAGGMFTGAGIVGNEFYPVMAGTGSHIITYTYTDIITGCSNDTSASVTVHALPAANFSGLATDYCEGDTPATLTPGTPGGFFTGVGVKGNVFNPSIAKAGTHQVTYWQFNAHGCFDTEEKSVVVHPQPVINMSGLASGYCEDVDQVPVNVSPAGGTLSGPGVSGNTFSPSAAGAGSHTINYSYTNIFGCSASKNKTVNVDNVPAVSISGLKAQYCNNEPDETLTGIPASPSGGFLGKGMDGNVFQPAKVHPGIHKVIYYVSTPEGCFNADTQYVEVKPAPNVDLGGDTALCHGSMLWLSDKNQSAQNYSWSTGAQTDSINVLLTQNRHITLTGVLNGCADSDSIFVEAVAPYVNLGPDTAVNASRIITLDAGPGFQSYLWSTGANTRFITLDSAGFGLDTVTVSVAVYDELGCIGMDNIRIVFEPELSMEEHDESPFTIYPNPGNGLFNLQGRFTNQDIIRIYDTKGAWIKSLEINEPTSHITLDLTGKAPGMYHMVISNNRGTISRKLMITP